MITPDFRIFQENHTSGWPPLDLERLGIEKVGLVWLFDAALDVHVASLTPSRELNYLDHFVELRDGADFDAADAAASEFANHTPLVDYAETKIDQRSQKVEGDWLEALLAEYAEGEIAYDDLVESVIEDLRSNRDW